MKNITTYILHGGASSTDSPENEKFFRSCTDVVSKPSVKILMCNWARPKAKWQPIFDRDAVRLRQFSGQRVTIDLLKDFNSIKSRLHQYDVFYINGGWGKYLEPHYPELEKIIKAFKNKVIVGSSMGAFIVAKHFVYSLDDKDQDMTKVHPGFGLLAINILCHWDIETMKEQKLAALKKHAPNFPILTLNEGQSVIIYQ